jgi:DNA-binding HxlR family transcriptional regulator
MGVTRFDDFRAELGIADNILSSRLTRLVDAGLLVRVTYRDQGRTRHEYRLTTAGADVLGVLHALAGWGQEHTEPMVALRNISSVQRSPRTSVCSMAPFLRKCLDRHITALAY